MNKFIFMPAVLRDHGLALPGAAGLALPGAAGLAARAGDRADDRPPC